MRIAFIDVTATVSYGGIQTAIWGLARELSARSHTVTVYGGDGPLRPLAGEADAVDVRTFPFVPRERVPDLGTRFRRIVERWAFARHARRSVISADHDWVIVTKPYDFLWPRLMPRGSRARFCFISGGTGFYHGDRYLARSIDVMVACSHFNAWQVGARYRCHPAVIYNGVDPSRFAPSARSERVRGELGAGVDDVLMTFAGRLVGWKGLSIAVDALADPRLRGLPLHLAIVGDGPERSALEVRARARGVEARVTFRPPVAHREVAAIYASSDLALFPSIGDEAFGIAIAEAMSCGCAVIASHIGGIPEVVGNEGHAGLLVAPGRSGDWVAQIAGLAADPARRRALGTEARARILEGFTWSHSAARLLDELGGAG